MANWKCGNCGYMLEADTPPEKCPSCKKKPKNPTNENGTKGLGNKFLFLLYFKKN